MVVNKILYCLISFKYHVYTVQCNSLKSVFSDWKTDCILETNHSHKVFATGNNKRKLSGQQQFFNPKSTTTCSPGVKKNKRGETPLHVAAIKVREFYQQNNVNCIWYSSYAKIIILLLII